MYSFPGTYFHPWLQPRHCATRDDLLDLLATDTQWRDHRYTEAERYQLRAELAQQQEKERAVIHAKLLAEARHRAALQELTAMFREGTQVIAGYGRAIVITPGDPTASIYIELDDGSFQFSRIVPAAAVLPDGSIRLPKPPTPLTGTGNLVVFNRHVSSSLDTSSTLKTDASPSANAACAPALHSDHPQPDIASMPKPETVTPRDAAPQPSQGRPRRFASAQAMHDELVTVGKTLPQDSLYRQEDYADGMGISPDTLHSHLRYWRKYDPTGLLRWKRIVSDTKTQHLG